MSYFFVKNATTNFGPINFSVYVPPLESLAQAVEREAGERGLIICNDWISEPLFKDKEEG